MFPQQATHFIRQDAYIFCIFCVAELHNPVSNALMLMVESEKGSRQYEICYHMVKTPNELWGIESAQYRGMRMIVA